MAYLRGSWRSGALEMNTHFCLVLPEYPLQAQNTLILLHGLKGGADDWMTYNGVQYWAQKYNLAIVMPEVQRSWYCDMAYGPDYFGYVAEELPDMLRHYFHIPTERAHLYVGGQSMGGYGALKCALTYPDRFAGCMSLSARMYLKNKAASVTKERHVRELQGILGLEQRILPENDLDALLEKTKSASERPRIYIACGTEDTMSFPECNLMSETIKKAGLDMLYETWPGIHSWDFWRDALPRGLAFLFDH